MDKRKSNKKSNSVQNESGFADGFIPTKLGRNMRVECCCKSMGNTKEVSYQKRDGTNIEKGEDASGATIAGRMTTTKGLRFKWRRMTWHSVSSYESSAVDTFKPGFNLTESPLNEK
ncbi:uncharacterized protein LOC120159118 isoform X1 [Hibiscus syriacus]|uniref:uncharacterized protein LOC120159118 isoform X1 n=1 Tax=Hibiscus syriacus TaxID=106335 RepID=UPI001920FDC2|nr:uncharacterized protein LOC120159118 isoform X1 [Hibiscus syriacus]